MAKEVEDQPEAMSTIVLLLQLSCTLAYSPRRTDTIATMPPILMSIEWHSRRQKKEGRRLAKHMQNRRSNSLCNADRRKQDSVMKMKMRRWRRRRLFQIVLCP
jgi:hypothetical protein